MLGIEAVEPRTSLLERRIPGGRGTRPVAANVDQVVVVIAAADPAPIPQLLDRLLVVAEANDIPALVVINKIDLAPADRSDRPSCRDGLRRDSHRRASAGKGSRRSAPRLERQGIGVHRAERRREVVADERAGTGSGTANRRRVGPRRWGAARTPPFRPMMIPLAIGGFVVDTPGFSEVGMWAIDRAHLDECFPEFRAVIGECKFDDCTHRTEPGCAVRALVDAGVVPSSRYETYLAIFAELVALPEDWQ